MDRRSFLTGLGGAAAGLGIVLLPGAADAKNACAVDKKRKVKVCTVALNAQLKHIAAQRGGNTVGKSWLACVQMIFKHHGHFVPEATILKEAYDGKLPSSPWKHLDALSHSWTDLTGRRFATKLEKMHVSATEAAEILSENHPLIIGAFGHPVVLTAMSYTGDRLGGLTLVEAKVLDPLGGRNLRTVSSPEWVNVSFITRISIQKAAAKGK